MSLKTVLITGSSGFIGSCVTDILLSSGWKVTTTTRDKKRLDTDACLFLDLSDASSVINICKHHDFDAIVHFGAHIGWSGQSIEKLFMPNIVATGLLSEFAAKIKAKFIFASAAIVHGAKTEFISLDMPVFADTPYGESKWLAEQLLTASGAKNCVLRIGGVYGKNGPHHLGLNSSISNAIKKLPVQLHGPGEVLRNYIYVKDIANSIKYVLDNDIEGTHLLAGTEVLTIKSMLQSVCDVFTPDQDLRISDGYDSNSQVLVSSDVLPRARSFKDALLDIKMDSLQ
jgi:nucleoside-diphosphate-sugar epimerase